MNRKNVYFSAIVLDEKSTERLYKIYNGILDDEWEFIGKYMLINMGEINPESEKYLGFSHVGLRLKSFGYSDDVLALGVSGFSAMSGNPHIVLAVKKGIKYHPEIGNTITKWTSLKPSNQTLIRGTVTEVKYNI